MGSSQSCMCWGPPRSNSEQSLGGEVGSAQKRKLQRRYLLTEDTVQHCIDTTVSSDNADTRCFATCLCGGSLEKGQQIATCCVFNKKHILNRYGSYFGLHCIKSCTDSYRRKPRADGLVTLEASFRNTPILLTIVITALAVSAQPEDNMVSERCCGVTGRSPQYH